MLYPSLVLYVTRKLCKPCSFEPKKFIYSSSNELYINFFGSNEHGLHNFLVTYNTKEGYSIPVEIRNDKEGYENYIFWRYTYHKGKFYSASYRIPILGGYT